LTYSRQLTGVNNQFNKKGEKMNFKAGFFVLTLAVAFTASACGKADFKSDKGKYSYAIGFNIGSNMKKDDVELDQNSFVKGIEDAINGKESGLSPEESQMAMQNLMMGMQAKKMKGAEESKKQGDAYLAANKAKEGVKSTASGLQYKVIKEGNGPRPKATDMVKVHYAGKLIDGTEFDSSYKRNEPASFKLNEVIKGWTEGLQLMTVGSKYELVIPSDLGYGPMGNQGIPGNALLIFEVELISIGK
jgi:FKBP-type peptidyl-prolyl cis-trans isomerase